MFYGISGSGEKTSIHDALDGEEYTCSLCGGTLVKKRGDIKVWHFAHKTLIDCDKWAEMSEWHLDWQSLFKPEHIEIAIIEPSKRHRADVKCGNVIIEFQHSSLAGRDFDERTAFYKRHGHLIWVFDVKEKDIYERSEFKYMMKGIFPDTEIVQVPIKGTYKWSYAYKFNGLVYKEYSSGFDMFLEISDYELVKVKWSSQWGWKYFGGESYTIEQFKQYVNLQYKKYKNRNYLPNDFRLKECER